MQSSIIPGLEVVLPDIFNVQFPFLLFILHEYEIFEPKKHVARIINAIMICISVLED
jgi:hypothetical protein